MDASGARRILVVNCGSSSVKFQVYAMDGASREDLLADGLLDAIGTESSILRYAPAGSPARVDPCQALDHVQALHRVMDTLTCASRGGVIAHVSEIAGVGHRVVHGGEHFTQPSMIDAEVITKIRECIDLAPLHNPHNLSGIEACRSVLPGVPQVAVFDTAFHQTMPPEAYIYGLPWVLYERHRIRRYGFHGTSHEYVHARAMALTRRADKSDLKVVTAHLGNGASMAAVRGGRCVETSMGMTPLEGLIMGTRCGDLDAAVVLHVMAKEDLMPAQVSAMMNKHSGLVGISGSSYDMRALLAGEARGDARARLAIEAFCHRARKYVGAYAATMGGLDVLAFTAGIGTFSPEIRKRICDRLGFLGIEIDAAANALAVTQDRESRISTPVSKVEVLVIPTKEELMIARATLQKLPLAVMPVA